MPRARQPQTISLLDKKKIQRPSKKMVDCYIFAATLALLTAPDLICGFATQRSRTHTLGHELDDATQSLADNSPALLFKNGPKIFHGESQDSGRRHFLSLVGAASALAISEGALALDELPSTSVAISDNPETDTKPKEAEAVANGSIDTRAIFDKAAKKALGGELACHLQSL